MFTGSVRIRLGDFSKSPKNPKIFGKCLRICREQKNRSFYIKNIRFADIFLWGAGIFIPAREFEGG